jgi:RHS repeat-associated protein
VQLTGDNSLSLAEVEVMAGTVSGEGVKWLVQDHLGSTRMVVDRSGSLGGVRRHDFAPFGEELSAGVGIRSASLGYGGDLVRQKFGSKERDNETGLDFFESRYFSSVQGRFVSPDDFTGGPTELFAEVAAHNPTFYADILDPQSLNKYAYCLNNPLKFVDPDGHQSVISDALALQTIQSSQIAVGIGKTIANIYIDMKNASPFVKGKPTPYYEPSNMYEDYGMTVSEHLLLLSGFAGRRMAPVNVAVAEGESSGILAARATQAGVNKNIGTLGETALGKIVGGADTRIGTPGTRQYTQIDRLVAGPGGVVAHESKVGYVSSVSGLDRAQVAKYANLLATGKVNEVVYHFFRNPNTGKIGASQKVLDYLKKQGFRYEIHENVDITK